MRAVLTYLKRLLLVLLGLVLVVVAGVAVLLFTPILDPNLGAKPNPLRFYEDAVAAIEAVKTSEATLPLIDNGGSYALLTGKRTDAVVVIFHGYTNTPYEFRLVAKAYRDQGFNVWVPRLPHHAMADKMTSDFSNLTAEELRDFADRTIDIAAGLGKQVTVVGLSGGGSLALWSATERREVKHAILISPLLQPGGYAEWVIAPIVRAMRLSPVDSYSWWDPDRGPDNTAGMVYPRYSLKGIGALIGLRLWVDHRLAQGAYPVPGSILLIRNDGDPSIDHDFNERYVAQLVPPERAAVFRIPASAGLEHDIVAPDPEFASDAQVVEAYQQLAQALGIPMPDPLAER